MRQRTRVAAILASISVLVGAWGSPVFAAEPLELPVRLSEDNHLIVEAMVNDQGPYTFVLDTAAGGTVVFDRLVEAAGLAPVADMPPIQVHGASGTIEAIFVNVGEIKVGEWHMDLDRAIALPAMPTLDHEIYGILGVDVLMTQPVGFRLSEGTLALYEQGTAIDAEEDLTGQWFSVPVENRTMSGPILWTEVSVNGVAMQAIVDTGARRTTINSAGAAALGINIETANLAEDEPIRGGANHSTPAWILPVSTVQFGDRVWGSRNLTLSDPAVLSALGVAAQPTIIFGADFLAEQDFIIDPIANVIWMQARRAAALGGFGASISDLENTAPLN